MEKKVFYFDLIVHKNTTVFVIAAGIDVSAWL